MKKYIISLSLIGLLIVACSDDALDGFNQEINQRHNTELSSENIFPQTSAEIIQPEMHSPYIRGEQRTYKGHNFDIKYERIGEEIIYQGDIILSKDQLSEMKEIADRPDKGAFITRTNRRWTDNLVPYEISSSLLNTRVLDAMNDIEASTNIVFVQRNARSNRHRNYIRFVLANGNSSAVGMQGGRQNINLASNSNVGIVIHEICHALGMWHESSRNDRNNNIIVNTNNIQSGFGHNFDQNNITIDIGRFDFGSIMMYGPCFFANACLPAQVCNCTANEATITRLNGTTFNVNRDELSRDDIRAINQIYPFHNCTNVPCCRVTCRSGFICDNGDCVPDPFNNNFCRSGRDCNPGERCFNGRCVPL